MSRAYRLTTLLVLPVLIAGNAHAALTKFSRACNFEDIPPILKTPVVVLSTLLGMPTGVANVLLTAAPSTGVLRNYWALESFTADYGFVRYYLFAESRAYRYWSEFGWSEEQIYRSPGEWTASSVSEAVYNDSRLSIFYANRGFPFTNARAGTDGVFSYVTPVSPYQRDQFRVVGSHWYYDPSTKVQVNLGKSNAADCNPTATGVGWNGLGYR